MVWERYNQVHSALRFNSRTIANIYKDDDICHCLINLGFFTDGFQVCDINSIEEIELLVTAHIYSKCNQVINELHKVREQLPDLNELRNKVCDKTSSKYGEQHK